MKLQLGKKVSDVIVAIYLVFTLFVRFLLEPQLQGRYVLSILLGAFGLLFLWALVKSKFLNPGWFGLLDPKEKKDEPSSGS
ncbi:MAG: hypothetical protein AAF573_12305 [Bacteroidota bacterium]